MRFDFDPSAPDATLAACEAAISAQIGATEITTAELARRHGEVALVDLRTNAEQVVSMIPGAVAVADDATPDRVRRLLAGQGHGQSDIVIYCAVGLRSARLVARWRAGDVAAYSLRGGIFRWRLEGRPLDGPTPHAVHPFDARWGRLLAAGC